MKGSASAGTIKESKDVSEDVPAYCGLANLTAIVPVPQPGQKPLDDFWQAKVFRGISRDLDDLEFFGKIVVEVEENARGERLLTIGC